MQALAQRRNMQCVFSHPYYLLFIQHSQCPRILHSSGLPIPSRLAETYSNYKVYCIHWQMGVPIASKAYAFIKPKSISNAERRQWQAKIHEWSEKCLLLFISILLLYVCYMYLHVCYTHDIGEKGKETYQESGKDLLVISRKSILAQCVNFLINEAKYQTKAT